MPSYFVQSMFSPIELYQYKMPTKVVVTVEADIDDVTPEMKEAMRSIMHNARFGIYNARFGIYQGHEAHTPQKDGDNDA